MKRAGLLREIALERISRLFELAIRATRDGDYERARRYVDEIFEIANKTKVRLPRKVKRHICRGCHLPLLPGLTARYRISSEGRGSRLVVTCLVCGWKRRYAIKSRKG